MKVSSGNSYLSPSLSHPVSLRCFRLTAGGSSIQQPPAHLFDSENSRKRSKRDFSPLPPVLFALTADLHSGSAPPLKSQNLPLKQPRLNTASIKSLGSHWDYIFYQWTMKNRWISSGVLLLLCPVFISHVTLLSLSSSSLPFSRLSCFPGHDICVLLL